MSAIKSKDELDADWQAFEEYVEQDENHENPDPRDIQWPNDMYWKVTCLSGAWRVTDGLREWEPVRQFGDLAMPIANMLLVGYLQFPNSVQRLDLELTYAFMIQKMGIDGSKFYANFGEMLTERRSLSSESYHTYIDYLLDRYETYSNDFMRLGRIDPRETQGITW